MARPGLLVVGASARAAAWSAARAGYAPWWIDQFGDLDLSEHFPGRRIPPGRYPAAIAELARQAPPGPWVYTGALENHPAVLRRLASARPLWGNPPEVCARVRDPFQVAAALAQGGLPRPQVAASARALTWSGQWLVKPLASAGGAGIRPLDAHSPFRPETDFVQERIEGESRAALFAGNGARAVLVGVTHQLVGETALNARPFAYSGSIGPLHLTRAEYASWSAVGQVLAAGFGLKGLFGVDAIWRDGQVVPIEVNPRYTASVEVLERCDAVPPAIGLHAAACHGDLPRPPPAFRGPYAGKAYLFAPRDLRAPRSPDALRRRDDDGLPWTADLPRPGSRIRAGHPVLTVFASGARIEVCRSRLLERAAELLACFETWAD